MISFLFASLTSMVFWAVYFIITLFVGTMLMRFIAPKTYTFIISGKIDRHSSNDPSDFVGVALAIYLFWPFIAFWLLIRMIFVIAFSVLLGPAVRKLIVLVDAAMPSIEMKKKETR